MPTAPKKFSVLGPEREAAARKARDRERGTPADRGYDPRWAKYSEWFRSQPENAICACGCMRPTLGKNALGKPLGCVDHIIACDKSDARFWDMRNHQALTNRCHAKKTRRFDDSRGRMGTQTELQAMLDAARLRAESIERRLASAGGCTPPQGGM